MNLQQSIPSEINTFFMNTCGKGPSVEKTGKNSFVYRAEKIPVSLSTDSYGGCHIDLEGQLQVIPLRQLQNSRLRRDFEKITGTKPQKSDFF